MKNLSKTGILSVLLNVSATFLILLSTVSFAGVEAAASQCEKTPNDPFCMGQCPNGRLDFGACRIIECTIQHYDEKIQIAISPTDYEGQMSISGNSSTQNVDSISTLSAAHPRDGLALYDTPMGTYYLRFLNGRFDIYVADECSGFSLGGGSEEVQCRFKYVD